MSLDQLCVNTIRMLSVDGVQKANSGHPGLPMGAAPMAHALWSRHLKANPANPKWPDRDRFVLSGGHGSMLLYSLLHLAGYPLTIDDLKSFRQWESKTPGHPEYDLEIGVETTTGPLGQGFATAVGMAMAEAHLAARFNTPTAKIVDHFTYVLASDGDMMEGVASESASLAGHLGLGKLVCLYDANGISLAGANKLSFTEDVGKRFESYGWHVQTVADGNDVDAIDAAIKEAKAAFDKPSLIVVHTIIGFGSPNKAGSCKSHGSPLGKEEVLATKKNLGWPEEPAFFVPDEVRACYQTIGVKGVNAEDKWRTTLAKWSVANPALAKEWEDGQEGKLPNGWDSEIPVFTDGLATRASAGKVLNAIAKKYPALIGGSADLNPSTNTALKGFGDYESSETNGDGVEGAVGGGWNYAGRNLHYGVREHAMGAAANGMALHGGVRSYTATFFNFLDYMKPAVRLAGIMKQPVIYVFTHDSIALGEDGPTHQPIEQLATLRATPNVVTIRPGDANESAEAWKVAAEHQSGPVAMVLTRQKLPTLDRNVYAPASSVRKGAYILKEADGGVPDVVLVASGSEVSLIIEAAAKLVEVGVKARIVSMPSWELFEMQSDEYKASVLPAGVKKMTVEAGATIGWHKYAGSDGDVIGIDHFGASAPAEVLFEKFGLTADCIAKRALKLIGKA